MMVAVCLECGWSLSRGSPVRPLILSVCGRSRRRRDHQVVVLDSYLPLFQFFFGLRFSRSRVIKVELIGSVMVIL